MRRIKVILCGFLKKLHPEPIIVVAENAVKAIDIATRQVKGLRPHPTTGRKCVSVPGFETIKKLTDPITVDTLYLVPAFMGRGGDGLTRIIVGALLIAVSFAMGGVFWPAIIFNLGASLVIGGVMQLIAPQPELGVNDAQQRSKYLGSPSTTVQLGTPIPILYGRDKIGGHFLSFDIQATETGL